MSFLIQPYLYPLQTMFESIIHLDEPDLENLPFHYHLKDKSGKYIACNKRVYHDAGFKKAENLLGLTDLDLDFLLENQALEFRAHDRYVREARQGKFFIEDLTMPSSNQSVAMSYKIPLFSKSNKIIGTKALSFIFTDSNFDLFEKCFSSTACLKDTVTLTKRQLDCVYYLIKGMTIKQIAHTLHLSPKTIEHYLEAVKIKMNCNTRFELIEQAMKLRAIKEKLLADL